MPYRPLDASKLGKIGAFSLAGIAALVLGYQVFKGEDLIERVPDDEALKTAWVCKACGEVFELTPRDRVELQRKGTTYTIGGKAAGDKTESPKGRGSFRELILRCPECGEMELRKAAQCPSCKAPLPAEQREAKQKKCGKCGWESRAKRNPRRNSQRPRRRPGG